jgi:hypothetical protein
MDYKTKQTRSSQSRKHVGSAKSIMAKKTSATPKETMEQVLWSTANKLRKNMDAAEYKHIVLGLIFLKYISDSFTELYNYIYCMSPSSSLVFLCIA